MLKLEQKPATTEAIKQSWFKPELTKWKAVKRKIVKPVTPIDDDDDIFNNPEDEDLWAESTLGFMNK